MFQRLTALILLIAFTAHTFNRAAIVLDYFTNTASFAKNCENKARPQMRCHGKCQMMKKLQQEEKKDQDNPERRMENKNEVVAWHSFEADLFADYHIIPVQFPSYAIGQPVDRMADIFHPPATA